MTVVVRGGRALTGDLLTEMALGEIVIENGVITAISARDSQLPDGAVVVDASEGFVMPALTDAHVHFDLSGCAIPFAEWEKSPAERMLVLRENGRRALESGICAVRDVGSVDDTTVTYARVVQNSAGVGPRVRASGRMIMMTGGHCSQYGREADGADAVRKAVREQICAGSGLIKVMGSGGFSTEGSPDAEEYGDEEIGAAVAEAHRARLTVAVHAHAAGAVSRAIRCGADTVEHGGLIGEEQIAALRDSGTPLVPTLQAMARGFEDQPDVPADIVSKVTAGRKRYRASIQAAIAGGVTIAAGTDAGTVLNPIGGLVDELRQYVELGMDPVRALRAATVESGRLVAPTLGQLTPGYLASLIVLDGDPRADLSALDRPRKVILEGEVLDPSALGPFLARSEPA